MTSRLLREIERELNTINVQTSKGLTRVKQLKATKSGGLRVIMDNGVTQNIPKVFDFLDERALRTVLNTAKEFKKRGLIGSTITFFKLLAWLIVLLFIGIIVLIFATIRALFR